MRYKATVVYYDYNDDENGESLARTVYIEAENSKSAEAKAVAFGRAQYEEDFVGVESLSEVKV